MMYHWLVFCALLPVTVALSSTQGTGTALIRELQYCLTPKDVLTRVAKHLSSDSDPLGSLSSLVLVRLCKQIIALDNQQTDATWKEALVHNPLAWNIVSQTLAASQQRHQSTEALDASVEGTKAAAVLSRILPELRLWEPLFNQWQSAPVVFLQPHQLSGLKWALDCFQLSGKDSVMPLWLKAEYDALLLPFRIIPQCCQQDGLIVSTLEEQVQFQVDVIRTNSNQVVPERRKTAWQGDDHVPPFAYSGKSMETQPWSPLVRAVRNGLVESTGQYYDGCLLNLYPDGGSGMRYHIDPDQGTLWDYETAVVSIGATRRFAFREIPDTTTRTSPPHTFVVMQGDVTEMTKDCQLRFQHTVKAADDKKEKASRASLVFKRTLSSPLRLE